MKIFETTADLAQAHLKEGQIVWVKDVNGALAAYHVETSGVGVTLANGNVAILESFAGNPASPVSGISSTDTVATMKSLDLPEGTIVETKGYTTAGDGGGAKYLIQTSGDYGSTPDGYVDIPLANTNVAVLQNREVKYNKEVIIWAHRGFTNCNVQNTMPAFSEAREFTRYLEADMQVNADGEVYIFHDTDISGLTTGTGTIASNSSVTLDSLSFDQATASSKYSGIKIAKLDELLEFARRTDSILSLELKLIWSAQDMDNLATKLASYGFDNEKCHLSFGYIVYAEDMRQRLPDNPVHYVHAGGLTAALPFIERLADIRPSGLYVSQGEILAEDYLGTCTKYGIDLTLYTTVSKKQIDDALSAGVRNIISDIVYN